MMCPDYSSVEGAPMIKFSKEDEGEENLLILRRKG